MGTTGTHPDRLDEADDGTLAARAADGDVRAFETLVRRHAPVVRAYSRRILGSNADVDDVTQDTFISAWNHLDALDDRASVRGWLFRIASRKCFDVIRARRPHDDIDDLEVASLDESPDARAEAGSLSSAVSVALDQLKPEQRRAWVLRELGGYSYDEIGAEMDLPATTVRGLLTRARAGITARMEGWR